ncbi:AAA family ATPase [Sporosarcina sp. G11-34]|uniref:AAA family ATPase n=1 Tax=Sporosarcina sp. G11-34 TaxID=2849605 RepID=UPI0022A9F1B7|nr:AAA family ATPase [Sporosarcina sp. G11-34]MCZ2259675.1 AAA family ATPase [Sporosarcina sp. G11-34]
MKPVTLKMTGFGPYKETEIVDFRELKDNRLFVISGATGSGKTTIFDGICFALYGQASGEDRTDIRAMRSDFADNETQTAVELIFEIHNKTYRVMRQIPYIKAGNKNETAARCELYEQTENGEVPIVDRQIVSEINTKVEDLIGFTQAQFSQIVMLPQGEFRKFLTSDTENKETIMRKIFKTEPYREIVDRLKVKKDEAQAALLNEKQQSNGLTKQISSLLPERDSTIFSVLANENYNVNQVVEGLEEELLFYNKKTIDEKSKYEKAYKRHEEMFSNYHAAKGVNERFIELDQRRATIAELSKQIPFMEKESKRLGDAERAVSIEQIELQFVELKQEVAAKAAHLEKTAKTVQVETKNLEEIEIQYKVEEEKQPEREKLTESLIRLTDSLPLVSELASKKEALAIISNELNSLQIKLNETVVKSTIETEKVTSLKVEIDELEKRLTLFDEQVELLTTTIDKSRVVDEFVLLKTQTAAFEQEKIKHETIYLHDKNVYEKLAADWLANEAATLAESLHDGDSCPVCGSVDHPKKAHRGNVEVTKDELELSNKALSEVEGEYRTAVANYQSALNQLEGKQVDLATLEVDVENVEVESSKLHAMKQTMEEEVTELRKSRKKLTELRESLNLQTKIADELNQEKLKLERDVLERSASLKTSQAIFDHTLQSIPEDVRDLKVLEQRIAELNTKKTNLDHARKTVQKLREDGRERVTTSRSAEIHAKTSLVEAEEKKAATEVRFFNELKNSEFASEEAYQEAKMDVNSRNSLKATIENFKQQFYSIREAVKELAVLLEGKEKVDISGLDNALVELKTAYESALKDYNSSVEYEKTAARLKEKLLESSTRETKLEKEFGKVTDLYDIVRGHNGLRLSFERYIQIEYLEQIIHSANERLRDMSNGQYELIRSDRQEVRGRQSGLGLAVYDSYTGQTRDVKTLSGGEKFNTSLCLALGMADVIQSFQGAVSIDTMFIDEGFGSLDEESLNKAIDTLIDLQKSGRMIGVISHVEELKAAFPAILDVKKSREGHSHTEFLIK